MAYSAYPAIIIERVRVSAALLLATAYLGAVLLRLLTLDQYLVQVDEPASLLAVQLVAERGVPLFPSDVLYLQGAVLSYLAAPLAWFFDGNSLLHAVRLLNILLSSLVVPLAMMLVQRLTSSSWAAVFAWGLVACDPNLMIWSVAIRPYGLLAVETVGLVYCFLRLVEGGAAARIGRLPVVIWIPMLSFVGTFTHIGYWLSVPVLAVIALMVWGRSLFTRRRAILLSGVASSVPLALFLVLGKVVGIGSGTTIERQGITQAFVGSHLFNWERWREGPSFYWNMWLGNFDQGMFHETMPILLALLSGMVLLRAVDPVTWRVGPSLAAVVGIHWAVIAIVIVFVTSDPATRYVNQILPFGYIIAGIAVHQMWSIVGKHVVINAIALRVLLVVAIILPLGLNAASAAHWRMNFPGGDPNYWQANEWLADHHRPGQAVITTLPPASYFWFDEPVIRNDFLFLAGPEGSDRSLRYTKTLSDDSEGDYWLGVPSLDSESRLCIALKEHAGNAWILTDWGRLNAPWAFRGATSDIVLGASDVQFSGANGVIVLSVRPVGGWSADALHRCDL